MVLFERRAASAAALLSIAAAVAVLARYGAATNLSPVVLLGTALAFAVVLTLAAWGAGIHPVRRALPGLEPAATVAVSLALGAGALALAAFVLGVAGILSRWSLAAVVTTAVAAGIRPLRRMWGELRPAAPRWSVPSLLLVLLGAASLLAACTDCGFYDQLNYHVAMPFHWLRTGSLVVFPRHDYSYLPANQSLLFTYAVATLGPWGAQVVHWWSGALAALSAGLIAATLAGPKAGSWAAAVFVATPAVALSATWAASDLGAAAFAGAAWLVVARASAGLEVDRSGWLLAGVLAGLAAGTKLLTLATVVGPLALAVPLVSGSDSVRSRFARAVVVGSGAAVAFLPWAARALVLTGNPLYPLWSGSVVTATPSAVAGIVDPSMWRPAALVAWIGERLSAFSLGTFSPQGAAGNIGPVYLFLLPLVALWVFLEMRARALVMGVVLAIIGWSLLPPLGRYLIAPLLVLAALGAAAWERLSVNWPQWVAATARGLLVLGLIVAAAGVFTGEAMSRVSCSLGVADREEWRRFAIDTYRTAEFVNRELPRDARLLLVAESRSLYLDRDVVVEDPFQTPLLSEQAVRLGSAGRLVDWLREERITHVLVNWREAERMAQLNGRSDYFGVEGRAREVLAALFRNRLKRVFADGQIEVLAVPAVGRE